MIDAVFDVSPSGIFGMDILAKFLNGLQKSGAITDWSPRRAITESKGARYVVHFAEDRDAACATKQWAAR